MQGLGMSAVLAGGLACVLAGQADAGTPVLKVMPLGDSITQGTAGGYRTALYNLLGQRGYTVDFVGSSTFAGDWPELPDSNHEGHGGWRVNNIDNNIVGWMQTYQPDVIFLHIGTNDISNNESAGHVAWDLGNLLQTIFTTDPEVTVYTASIILRTDSTQRARVTDQYAALTPGVVQHWADLGFDCRFVDMHAALGASDLADGIHPNQTGYDKMGVVWADAFAGNPSDLPLAMTLPRAGQDCTVSVTGADAGAEVRFYGTLTGFGATEIADLGVTLDLAAPAMLGATTANGAGEASITKTISTAMGGKRVTLQAAQAGRTSQALVRVVRN